MQTMRVVSLLAVGATCFAFGWFTREATYEAPVERSTRSASRVVDDVVRDRGARASAVSDDGKTLRPVKSTSPVHVDATPDTPPTATNAPAEATPDVSDKEGDPLREMIESQGPQWKAFATMQAKPKIAALLAALGYDEETTRRIEEAMLKDLDVQIERSMAMMLGDEDMDPGVFDYFMGIPPDLNEGLERELGTFLNDNEIDEVRGQVRKSFKKQQNDFAELQVNMMSISNLSTDQRTRLKDVFIKKNPMKEQFVQFAEVSRDRDLLKKALSGEVSIADEMKRTMTPQRERVAQILTPQQMEQYAAFEQQQIRQAEMGMKMMGAMFKGNEKKAGPAVKTGG